MGGYLKEEEFDRKERIMAPKADLVCIGAAILDVIMKGFKEELINTTGTNLCTRPLEPAIFAEPSIAWKKNAVFSKASQAFLAALQERFTL